MANDPILHLIGLAKKAGRLEVGDEPVGAVCRARQAKLILVAGDAASNTFRRAAHFGEAGNVLWLSLPHTKEELGFTLGRSSVAMLALTDVGFAASIVKKLAAADPEKYAAAAAALDTKATKALQRQKEQRQHEKNLRQGKHKPWAPPPPPKKENPTVEKKPAPKSAVPSRKPGPVGRRMSGKIVRSNPVNKAQEPKNRGGFQ
ncbi:MAG: 50S ribosomal protein L7 [Oscillospiraceae bacterium]|nr:50S ribosomal protein L7 [Oscillospiraceae bacterium]